MSTENRAAAAGAAVPVRAKRQAKSTGTAAAPAPAKSRRVVVPESKPNPPKSRTAPKAAKFGTRVVNPAPKAEPFPAPETPTREHPRTRAKLVRDSFTMPRRDFNLIDVLKDRALGFQRPTKKSELLRAGLQVLSELRPDDLKRALDRLEPLKTGRPKKTA